MLLLPKAGAAGEQLNCLPPVPATLSDELLNGVELGALGERSTLTCETERSGDHYGNLLPVRRSNANTQYRASDMRRVLGRFGYKTQANSE